MATAVTDNIDQARDWITGHVANTADAQGWSQADRDVAFADIEAAYDSVTGWNAGAFYLEGLTGSATKGEAQVTAFYSALAKSAVNWTAVSGDKLYAMIANLVPQTQAASDLGVDTPGDFFDAGVEVVTETASDVAETGKSRGTWFLIGAALAGVLILMGRRR